MIKVNWLISTTVRASTGSVRSITWVLLLSLLLVSSYRNMLSARFLRVNKFHSIVSRGRVSPLQLQSIHGKDVTIRLNSNNAIDSKTLDRSEKQRVKHISGLDGYICSKGKGGWWKLVLVDTVTSEEKTISARTSEFKLLLDNEQHVSISVDSVEIVSEDISGSISVTVPTVEAPARHAATKDWILFSDLHVKASSIDTCEEVLARVHEAAVERNAGIVFLGDFWHVRGSLSVDILNRVFKSLRKWTQPVVMIPGNHDQVTLGGTVHSLEPLVYAFDKDQILMISEPCICMDALWVPYRRDAELLQSILRLGASHPNINAVFCHADVKGAYMNDGIRSREGIDISCFPSRLPIYSGHFHKPHTMKKNEASLRYVGSPYQTSLSEAGEKKYLYCLRREPQNGMEQNVKCLWKEKDRWPIDIGRKYIKAAEPTDPSIDEARPGDRVVLTVPVGMDYAAEELMRKMTEKGVEVELRYERSNLRSNFRAVLGEDVVTQEDAAELGENSEASLTKIEDLSEYEPVRLFRNYMESFSQGTELNKQASDISSDLNLDVHKKTIEEGLNTIERIQNSVVTYGSNASETAIKYSGNNVNNLHLERLVLKNFGPYGGKAITYPLADRGLVLLRGQSSDGTGADSNGSGKTTLAMSVLWCLTGSMDTRLVADGRALDVAYDIDDGKSKIKKTAEVKVTGTINNEPFEIIRRRGPRKNELHFVCNNQTLTTQAIKDTQALIDSKLGIGNGLLQRCCFFGQHSHTLQSLLGLTDVKLKSELSLLVDTEIWTNAAQDIRIREKTMKQRSTEIDVEYRLRLEEIDNINTSISNIDLTIELLIAERNNKTIEFLQLQNLTVNNAIDSGTNYANIYFSSEEMSAELTRLNKNVEELQTNKLQSIQNLIMQTTREKFASTTLLRQELSSINELKSNSNMTIRRNNESKITLERKLNDVMNQRNTYNKNISVIINHINESLSLDKNNYLQLYKDSQKYSDLFQLLPFKTVHDIIDNTEIFRKVYHISVEQLASIDVKIQYNQKARNGLVDIDISINNKNSSAFSKDANTDCHEHKVTECPTCGQEMPLDIRIQREKELSADLLIYKREQQELSKFVDILKKINNYSQRLCSAQQQMSTFADREKEISIELQQIVEGTKLLTNRMLTIENDYKAKQNELTILENKFNEQEMMLNRSLLVAQAEVKSIQEEIGNIRSQLELRQQSENTIKDRERMINSSLALIQERIDANKMLLEEKENLKVEMEAKLLMLDEERKTISDQLTIFERLLSVFGPRGIQSYIFKGIISQIEVIANSYLEVLAAGGIHLSLFDESEDYTEKIMKSVWIRGNADGKLKERGLSQLSGGQWRRVSMALDLAFAELVRRKGVLRCNLIVMDEVLTHLDASGREAVGTVLRAMVAHSQDHVPVAAISAVGTASSVTGLPKIDNSEEIDFSEANTAQVEEGASSKMMQLMEARIASSGAYETVLVILQDLAAVELEEAFDYVDVVVKSSDISTVIIDGQD